MVGVHSAKFPNEKVKDNLQKAVQRYELGHPVVNDVDFQVWQQYACRAWPTLMFIDPLGKVIGKHEGELSYEQFAPLISQMVAEFDEAGILDRTPVTFVKDEAPDSTLSFPGKVVADAGSNRLFISDSNHNRIIVATLDGEALKVVGSGEPGMMDGSFGTATFDHPQGMVLVGTCSTWPTPRTMPSEEWTWPRSKWRLSPGPGPRVPCGKGPVLVCKPSLIRPGIWRFMRALCTSPWQECISYGPWTCPPGR